VTFGQFDNAAVSAVLAAASWVVGEYCHYEVRALRWLSALPSLVVRQVGWRVV
jgi:hypothetical protein